jgi:acetone carboxylase gamma subunit
VARTVAAEEHGPHIVLHEELSLREQACPACGTLLEAEVIRGDAPSLHSIELW